MVNFSGISDTGYVKDHKMIKEKLTFEKEL